MSDSKVLVIVNCQNDFGDNGPVGVEGATNVMKKIAGFINKCGDKFNQIVMYVDSHPYKHISHNNMWKYEGNNKTVEPGTMITYEYNRGEEKYFDSDGNLVYCVLPPIDLKLHPVGKGKWVMHKDMRDMLKESEEDEHIEWHFPVFEPYCEVGSLGEAVQKDVLKSIKAWKQNGGKLTVIRKNMFPGYYDEGAFVFNNVETASFRRNNENEKITSVLREDDTYMDKFYIVGLDVKSCVCKTAFDIFNEINETNSSIDAKVTVITDLCMEKRDVTYEDIEKISSGNFDYENGKEHANEIDSFKPLALVPKTEGIEQPTYVLVDSRGHQTRDSMYGEQLDKFIFENPHMKVVTSSGEKIPFDPISRDLYNQTIRLKRESIAEASWLLPKAVPPMTNIFKAVRAGRGYFPFFGANHTTCVVLKNDRSTSFWILKKQVGKTMLPYVWEAGILDQVPRAYFKDSTPEVTKKVTKVVSTGDLFKHAWMEVTYFVVEPERQGTVMNDDDKVTKAPSEFVQAF